MKPTRTEILSIVIMLTVIVGQCWMVYEQGKEISELRIENSYLNDRYQERYGFITSDRQREFIRLISIDGGKNWVEITRTREIVQPPYFHQRYPGLALSDVEVIDPK